MNKRAKPEVDLNKDLCCVLIQSLHPLTSPFLMNSRENLENSDIVFNNYVDVGVSQWQKF